MLRRWKVALLGGLGVVAIGSALLFWREPALAADAADGSYYHHCCGTIALKEGEMVLGGRKRVDYEIGRDAQGPYILPESFVGTWEDRGFEIDGTRKVEKLRVDQLPRPQTITLPALHGTHSFKRKAPLRR
jgi:hypothetical protein